MIQAILALIGLVMAGVLPAPAADEPPPKANPDHRPDHEKGQKLDETRWSFDADPPGKLPAGWIIGQTNPSKSAAVWEVAADPAAPSKPNVFSLVKTENTGGTFNLAIADKTVFRDLDLSVRLRANSGKEDQGGGLIWRSKDARNYYVCRVNPLEGNYRLYKVVDGKRIQLATAEAKTETGKWHALRLVMREDEMVCFLDGKQLLEARDDTFKDPGRVGLWAKADAASSFDEVVVHPVDPVRKGGNAKDRQGEKKN